jgi:hypothetical protein
VAPPPPATTEEKDADPLRFSRTELGDSELLCYHAFLERANASAQPLQLGGELLELVARQRQSATGWPQLGQIRPLPVE